MKLHHERIRAPLRGLFRAGHGEVSERELLLVTLEAADGLSGYGEAAPLPSYDGITLDEVRAALEGCREILAGADRSPPPQVIARCAEVVLAPQALAALDLALWDLAGRRVGMPAWRLLSEMAAAPEPVRVNWTLTAADRSGAVQEAAQARTAGFDTVKVKVAIGDDHGRLAAIRAFAGPDMSIRIDANGAWTPLEARAALRALEPVGIELCEEPVAGVAEIRELAADTEIPLALDESAADPAALPEARLRPDVPEDLALRRAQRPARNRPASPRRRLRGVLGFDARWPPGNRRRPARGRRAAPGTRLGAGHPGHVRRPRGSAATDRGPDPGPGRPRAR